MRTPPLILIVDDNPANVEILQMRLAANNYEIITASDGEEGLTKARNNQPDLILLDIMMPKKDGYEVCQTVRQDPELKDTHIILLTAKGQETDRSRGASSGALYYITKPFDPDHILELAKKLLHLEQ